MKDLEYFQNLEINIIGIIIVLIMLYQCINMYQDLKLNAYKLFDRMLLCNLTILVTDSILYVFNGKADFKSYIIAYMSCMVYFLFHTIYVLQWALYTIYRLYPEKTVRGIKAFLIRVPNIIGIVMVMTNPWTDAVFYFDDNNLYQRGKYMLVIMALSVLYYVVSAVFLFIEMIQQNRIRERSFYVSLIMFPVPTCIGNFIQMKCYGISVVWICTALSLLMIFIINQNNQISRDMLTGLFNRRETNKRIQLEIKRLKRADYKLFFAMIDVDYFKKINDTFGHNVGDQALISVAQILTASFRQKDFVGRFGGDEFIVMGHIYDENEIKAMLLALRKQEREFNEKSNTYKLSLSVGIRTYTDADEVTEDSIIVESDALMYEAKEASRV